MPCTRINATTIKVLMMASSTVSDMEVDTRLLPRLGQQRQRLEQCSPGNGAVTRSQAPHFLKLFAFCTATVWAFRCATCSVER